MLWHIVALLVLFVLSVILYKVRKNIAFGVLAALFSFVTGSMFTNIRWVSYDCSWEKARTEYHGEIRGEVIDKGRFLQFTAEVDRNKVLVRVMKDTIERNFSNGDLVCFYGKISRPGNMGNPYEMDYATYLLHNGITGTAFLQDDEIKVISRARRSMLYDKSIDLRHKAISLFRAWGAKGDELALLSALIVGERNLFSEEVEENYSKSGLAHVLSISGMHVGILLLIINGFLWFMKRTTSLRIVKWIILSLFLWIFAYVSGLAPSAVRAVIMCILLELMYFSYEKRNPLNIIFLTALCMLVYNPFYLFHISFQLSFAAVISIILFYSTIMARLHCRYPLVNSISSVVALSVSAQIGAAPLVLYYFSNFSSYFLLSNILSSFLIILITVIVLLSFVIPLDILHVVLLYLLKLQNGISSMVASLPMSVLRVTDFSLVNIVLIYVFSAFVLLYLLDRRRKYAIAMSVVCLSFMSFNFIYNIPVRITPHALIYSDSKMSYIHFVENRNESFVISPVADTMQLHPRPVVRRYAERNGLPMPSFLNDFSKQSVYSKNGIITWHGKRFCILCDKRWRRKTVHKPIDIDYLYISRGYYSISYLKEMFNIRQVILGFLLSDTSVNAIIKECVDNEIPFVNLRDTGYYKIMI